MGTASKLVAGSIMSDRKREEVSVLFSSLFTLLFGTAWMHKCVYVKLYK